MIFYQKENVKKFRFGITKSTPLRRGGWLPLRIRSDSARGTDPVVVEPESQVRLGR